MLHTGFGFLYSTLCKKETGILTSVELQVSDFYYLCFAQHFLACLCCQVWVPDSSYGRLYVMHAKVEHTITHKSHYNQVNTWRAHRLLMHHDYEVGHTFALISTSSWLISILLAFPSNGFLTEMSQRDFPLP